MKTKSFEDIVKLLFGKSVSDIQLEIHQIERATGKVVNGIWVPQIRFKLFGIPVRVNQSITSVRYDKQERGE